MVELKFEDLLMPGDKIELEGKEGLVVASAGYENSGAEEFYYLVLMNSSPFYRVVQMWADQGVLVTDVTTWENIIPASEEYQAISGSF